MQEHGIPGIALAIVHPSGNLFVERGFADAKHERPVTRDTAFEIGSITKVFTGLLLAQLVHEKKVRLDDPVARFFPDDVMTGRARAITLLSLSTHRSGLPRLPSNLRPNDRHNPYASYDEARLFAYLREYRPKHGVDERYLYSNLGVGMLGHALSRAMKTSYAELLQTRICEPLDLRATTVQRDSIEATHLAAPHDRWGEPGYYWDLAVLVGAGGIYSTTEDLARFLDAQLHPERSPWPEAIAETQRPHRPGAGRWGQRGLGWAIDGELVWHGGATGGFKSLLVVAPRRGFGVVVLGNAKRPEIAEIGVTLMRELLGLPS